MNLEQQILNWVTRRFIAEGKDSSVKEIAAGLGVSEDKVRKVFSAHHGCLPGLTYDHVIRDFPSKSYGALVEPHRVRVGVYGPTRSTLAQMVKTSGAILREALDVEQTDGQDWQPWADKARAFVEVS